MISDTVETYRAVIRSIEAICPLTTKSRRICFYTDVHCNAAQNVTGKVFSPPPFTLPKQIVVHITAMRLSETTYCTRGYNEQLQWAFFQCSQTMVIYI